MAVNVKPVEGADYVPMDVWGMIGNMTLEEFHSEPRSQLFWVHLGPRIYENYNWVFMWFGLLYVPLVFGGIKLMQNRQPFHLGFFLTFWNFLMAAFSAWGFAYTFYPMIRWVFTYSLSSNSLVCDFWIFEQPAISQMAVFFFVVSKVFEFIDTIFLVLRDRKSVV